MKNNYKRLIQNVGVFTLANFTSRFLSFLILPLYTYYLTTEEYGTIDLVNTTIQLLFPIFSATIVDSVLRFGISKDVDSDECFNIGVKIIAVGCLPLALVLAIANIFIKNSMLMVCFYLIYIVQAFNSLFAAYAKAINKTKQMATITTITSISILGLNVLFIAVFKRGIWGYWISTIIGNIIGSVLYFITCRLPKHIRILHEVDKKLLRSMLSYSLPLIPNALFWWINSSLDRWTLTLMTSMSMVGLYSCANKIPSILSTINTIFNQAWNLSLFQSEDENDGNAFFEDTYILYNEVMFCCTIGIIWLSKFVATYMFSQNFFKAWVFVPILTCGVYVNSLNGFLGSLFTARKQTKTIFTTTLIGSIINLALNFPFVFLWSGMGAAVATLFSYVAVWIIRAIRITKNYGIRLNYKFALFQGVLLLIETVMATNDIFWPIITLFVLVYCVLFFIRYRKYLRVL